MVNKQHDTSYIDSTPIKMAIALEGGSDSNNLASTSTQISLENKKNAGEMVGGCSVCSDDQGTEENPLVYCDGCEVAVHQACYGIVDVPPGNWFCTKCESGDSQNKIKCELCPSKDGALKKTEAGLWAHVVCALYIPEVRFGNNNTMEPIEIKHIQADRYNKNCYICAESGNSTTASYGAVMDCHKSNCKQSFHVTCAQTAGLLCEEAGQGSDNVIYCGYCKHHFRKLKAGNRKSGNSLNNSTSSYLDSASDSSQDNDSHCNITEHDKNLNRANKLSNLPANLSTSDSLPPNSHSPNNPSSATSNTKSIPLPNNTSNSLPVNSNSSSTKASSTTSSSSSTPQKKRRAPKSLQANSSSSSSSTTNSSTLLATALSPSNSLSTKQSSTAQFSTSNVTNDIESSSPQDVYKWSSKEQNEKDVVSNNIKSGKKKLAFSTQPSNTKLPNASTNNQSISMIGYNLNKIGSPNLSLSTSPSLASPSSSTKSTSNCSTSSVSTTTACSSSSTSPNSPSPALLSPNISNRGPTVRLESPLASNSKTGNNSHNRLVQESNPSNAALQLGQNNIQTRINLDNPKNDLKKNSSSTSSLLSTAVPMPFDQLVSNVTGSSSTTCAKTDNTITKQGFKSLNNNIASGSVNETPLKLPPASSVFSANTQPTVPPLIIPVPQSSTSSLDSGLKSTARPKAPAKSTSRKKSTETTEGTKPDPKPKPSRSKKATSAATAINNNNNNTNDINALKPEPKRGKSKATTKLADTTISPAETLPTVSPAKIQANNPSKRKSRSTSNESTNAAQPSPAKRPRKKKTDQNLAQTTDQSSTAILNPSTNANQPLVTAANARIGTSPLMINTPIANNRLMQGLNSAEGHDNGTTRYYSPMMSPYANFDHLNAPSLTRSSLSRLFTSSSANNNQPSTSDDPGKAFEELREKIWSNLAKCILEQAQQFDLPSYIGTLYTLRSEIEKRENRVREMSLKVEQKMATAARLELSGPMLTQHLIETNPNFASVHSGLTNSPQSLPTPSPGSAISKQAHVPVGSYNHVPPNSLGHPGYLDRSSPMVGQTHSGLSNIKSSSISTPSPPISALMAHSTSNRGGLITVNPPYMPNVFPPMNTLAQLGPNTQGSSYYPRQ